MSGVAGYLEAQQTHVEHRGGPEVDRSWSVALNETTTTAGRVRGQRHHVSRLTVAVASRVRTPGPQSSVADAVAREGAIVAALEGTTVDGDASAAVVRVTRSTTSDRAYHVSIFDLNMVHMD